MKPQPVATTKDTKTVTAKVQRPATKKKHSSSVKKIQPQPAMMAPHDGMAQTVKTQLIFIFILLFLVGAFFYDI
jgi:hypothetical protein